MNFRIINSISQGSIKTSEFQLAILACPKVNWWKTKEFRKPCKDLIRADFCHVLGNQMVHYGHAPCLTNCVVS